MRYTEFSPGELMAGLVAGNEAAFSEIYDRLCEPTFAICTHYLHTTDAADEAMRGVWLSVWRNAAMLAELPGSPWSNILATAEQHARFHAGMEALARTANGV